MFKKAEKKNLKLRLALCGPAGAGKTYSALSVASAMGGRIAVVDTEHGSASKYADVFEFDVVEPNCFDPRELIETIRYAEKNGYGHIIIDSLSHYWSGKGGELEMVDNAAARSKSANSFMAWKTVTPVHNELIDTIIGSKINVFVTMRTKTEYVVETNSAGKQVPRKVGLAPVMRDGIEYEFDICGDIDQDNNFVVTKSRCPALSSQVVRRPGKEFAEKIIAWLNSASAGNEKKQETTANIGTAATEKRESKEHASETKPLKFYKCRACLHVHTSGGPGTLVCCVKCNSKELQQFPDLESARKHVFPAPTAEAKPAIKKDVKAANPPSAAVESVVAQSHSSTDSSGKGAQVADTPAAGKQETISEEPKQLPSAAEVGRKIAQELTQLQKLTNIVLRPKNRAELIEKISDMVGRPVESSASLTQMERADLLHFLGFAAEAPEEERAALVESYIDSIKNLMKMQEEAA